MSTTMLTRPRPLPVPAVPIDRTARLRRDLRAIMADGAAYSVMVGLGETYLPAFALAVGIGEVAAGLLATVPLLIGGVLQLLAPWAVCQLGSRRRWLVLCATVQALAFLPLAAAAVAGSVPFWLALAIASIYWWANLATGPAWNTWMETLVPGPIRARYFAYRTRLVQVGVVSGFVVAGLALEASRGTPYTLAVFAAIFLVSGISRLFSAAMLWLHSEPVPLPADYRPLSLVESVGRLRGRPAGRLLVYMLAVQASVYVAAPFFSPFMLVELKFSYLDYMALIAVAFAAKILTLPALGRFAKQLGARRLLCLSGMGVVPLSGLWLVSVDFWYLLAVQIAGGVIWAGYELAGFLILFDAIPSVERKSILAVYNFASAAAMVIGSLAGACVLDWCSHSEFGYFLLFGISSSARLATLGLLYRIGPLEVRATAPALRPLSIRPSASSIDRPILATLATPKVAVDEHAASLAIE